MSKYRDIIDAVAEAIRKASKELDIPPALVTKTQMYKSGDCKVSEWQIRKVGGLQGVKRLHFASATDLSSIRHGKEVQKYINGLEKAISERDLFQDRILKDIKEAIKGVALEPMDSLAPPKRSKDKANMTMELMLSDIHYGLKTEAFDLVVCRNRMRHLTNVFLRELEDNQKLFNVERLIIALLGDIIQSYTMHGLESSSACEFGNFKQIESAITSIYYDVLLPIGKTGITIDVPAVTGNHDRTEKGRTYTYPGLNNATWAIYKSLEMLCEAQGLKNITFHIPEQAWVTLDIYGNNACYEHYDNSKAPTRDALEALLRKRQTQENKVLHFFRGGHYHVYMCFDRGRIIVNESVCGQEGYGTTLGYKSSAGQTINYYIETQTRDTCFFKSFPVALDHIGRDYE